MRATAAICIIAGLALVAIGLLMRTVPRACLRPAGTGRRDRGLKCIAFGTGMAGIGLVLIR